MAVNIRNFGVHGYAGNPRRAPITHPLASKVSFFFEPSDPTDGHVEAAFFSDAGWVTDDIEELAVYAEEVFMDTRVYRMIPVSEFNEFLARYEVRSQV